MSVNLPEKLKPSMGIAIDMLVSDPEAKIKDVAKESGVTTRTIHKWLKDPEFVEVFYQKYMVTFGAKLPKILNSMIREAEAGNVQAGRLVLEHSGKLVKRVEVANHKSPFEKFLNSNSSEMKEVEVVDADYEVFPQRPEVPVKPITKTELTQKKKSLDKKNAKRREARKWRARAKKVGVLPPKKGRQTPAQRNAWQEQVIKREKALNLSVSDE